MAIYHGLISCAITHRVFNERRNLRIKTGVTNFRLNNVARFFHEQYPNTEIE